MKILAIETSSADAGVAIAESGQITHVRRFDAPRGRGAEVFGALEELRPAWNGLDRLAIGIGPGSYNGLRVACALAGSFHIALGMDLIVSPSCCLLNVADPDYVAAGDARGGRIWWAETRARRLHGEIALLTPDEFRTRAKLSRLPLYRVGMIRDFLHLPVAVPDAAVLALLAADLPPADPSQLEPLYLKPPHITLPRHARP